MGADKKGLFERRERETVNGALDSRKTLYLSLSINGSRVQRTRNKETGTGTAARTEKRKLVLSDHDDRIKMVAIPPKGRFVALIRTPIFRSLIFSLLFAHHVCVLLKFNSLLDLNF